ncbi:hypothetical protein TST_0698 [Thermosulfidibacter takaii ABI70S6]|uniref:Uncharacterized protein n=1 Tax=Thermosulfidibacter takaii (strain DSM 17441 / JCM 13301 / NBRC 103674 / ABI70S6) TaxID=1298851 RepID=A0A0S3QT64_THET7|nr:hypothetical protein [Thermosulfidibacter takaii]BAT71503.1 hypothetical protein TST_0698 [Thermosulfidibacter takaii ABI70S6]
MRGVKIASIVFILALVAIGFYLVVKVYFSESYLHYRVGERFYREGRYRAAYEEFKRAFELDPYNRAARQRLADLKRIIGKNEGTNQKNR